jgi:hypothetical protein
MLGLETATVSLFGAVVGGAIVAVVQPGAAKK